MLHRGLTAACMDAFRRLDHHIRLGLPSSSTRSKVISVLLAAMHLCSVVRGAHSHHSPLDVGCETDGMRSVVFCEISANVTCVGWTVTDIRAACTEAAMMAIRRKLGHGTGQKGDCQCRDGAHCVHMSDIRQGFHVVACARAVRLPTH